MKATTFFVLLLNGPCKGERHVVQANNQKFIVRTDKGDNHYLLTGDKQNELHLAKFEKTTAKHEILVNDPLPGGPDLLWSGNDNDLYWSGDDNALYWGRKKRRKR